MRRAATGAGDQVPAGGEFLVGATGSGIGVEHQPVRAGRGQIDSHARPVSGRQREWRHQPAGQVIRRAVIDRLEDVRRKFVELVHAPDSCSRARRLATAPGIGRSHAKVLVNP